MHKRRPKAFRGKGIKAYCRMIEKRNVDLRRKIRETENGADQMHALVNAIMAAVVDKVGPIEIDNPVLGRTVAVEKRDNKLFVSNIEEKDTREPDTRDEETKCQEGASGTQT